MDHSVDAPSTAAHVVVREFDAGCPDPGKEVGFGEVTAGNPFRDHYGALLDRGVDEVFGHPVQSSDYRREARDRLGLTFEQLSDSPLGFTGSVGLPTFEVAGERLIKRPTLVLSVAREPRVVRIGRRLLDTRRGVRSSASNRSASSNRSAVFLYYRPDP